MRTWGRVYAPDGSYQWAEVDTDANGFNDEVYTTTLIQVLYLNLGESPFYADYGIPSKQSVIQQIAPDFYVARTQAQFAPYFASLIVAKQATPEPTYSIGITTNSGVKIRMTIPE